MDRMVTVINRSADHKIPVGDWYLFPGEQRTIHRELYVQARDADETVSLALIGLAPVPEEADDLTQLTGVGESRAAEMVEKGYGTFAAIADALPSDLMEKFSFIRSFGEADALIREAGGMVE